ncbi:MAG: helicase HerA domain-containing protein [Lachnospiraceae bacterium]
MRKEGECALAKYTPRDQGKNVPSESPQAEPMVVEAHSMSAESPAVYADSPGNFNFVTLQKNLQNCLSIVDNEVMKNYISLLKNCSVVPLDEDAVSKLEQIQFFRISELVYQEDEFSVHKLATIFNALSGKPCTLVLMIQSDGENNNFYMGIRSRDSHFSSGTMRQLLEQSFLGLFPGSSTDDYFNENMVADLDKLNVQAVSSVTCIADYKQDKSSFENKNFIQGLEKFIYSMQGKAFTAICIANSLEHSDLVETRKEYERIYTLMSPFATMQYNYAMNNTSATTESDTRGDSTTDTNGISSGKSITDTRSQALQRGVNQAQTTTDTRGQNSSVGVGKTHTVGISDGINDSETKTTTEGIHIGTGRSTGINGSGVSVGTSINTGVTSSVSRAKTHGTSHTDSVSDSVSRNLTFGLNTSRAVGNTVGQSQSVTESNAIATATQNGENQSHSISCNTAHTTALSETFGNSQAVTLNVQNKSLINTLQRLEKQLERLDECESIGMWDFAAYFLGESASEAETAANMYRSLISGSQSGLEIAAVNTWTDERRVEAISRYIVNFMHPVFLYEFADTAVRRRTFVDATALASTNELAIQLGLPRKSVKGLPVIEHALFAQEVLSNAPKEDRRHIELGVINHFGKDTETPVELDLESLSMHTFITGSTGSGKSNTVYQILSELLRNSIHFLVVEPAKGEYKKVFGGRDDVSVYGTNPLLTELLRINPFSFPDGVHIYEHLERLVEIFNVCWPMYAAMPVILKDAIERAYVKAGWDLRNSRNKYSDQLFPDFMDVLQQIDTVMEQSQYSDENKSDYKGALSTRLRSLTNGINHLIFTNDEISGTELFDRNVIIDLSRIGSSETKCLIMGLLVMKLQEHRMTFCDDMNAALSHVTVLEEAHNLLKRTSTEQSFEGSNLAGKSVEMLTNAIAEMRTYGEGFIIVDQAPALLDMAVIRNTNTKIIMRLPEYSDRELAGRSAGLKDEQIAELSKLSKGVAAIYQNDWVEAVLGKIKKYSGDNPSFKFRPENVSKHRDIKGELISRLIAKDIMHLIDKADAELVAADIPVAAKCRLFDYASALDSRKFNLAAAVAYELFSAEVTFSTLEKMRYDFEQQRRFLIENLTPPIASLPEKYSRVILYLVIYWRACITESISSKCLLNNLIETEGGD